MEEGGGGETVGNRSLKLPERPFSFLLFIHKIFRESVLAACGGTPLQNLSIYLLSQSFFLGKTSAPLILLFLFPLGFAVISKGLPASSQPSEP